MIKRPWFVFVILAVFILMVGAACSAGASASTATPEPAPTSKPLPTAEPKPTSALPKPSLPTQGAAPANAPFDLDTTVYEHPSGTFSFNPPVGWTPEEGQSGVVFTNPDGTAKIDFSATNTGAELDSAGLETFIKATEENYFGWRTDYQQVDYNFDKSNSNALVAKSFTDDNGTDQKVFTYYLQNGQGVYSFDFWAEGDIASDYKDPYANLLGTINVNGTKAADLPVYNFIYTFTDKNNNFQFEVPLSWTYAYDESKNAYTDTFTSPDGHAVMQNISYDDGTTFTKSDAGATALNILNQTYTSGAGDIKVTGDVVQADGSERLDWTSKKGNFSGESFFETRGTTFLMLSLLFDEGYSDVYGPVFDNTLNTYAVP
jgi:hypothetical protein